MTATSPTAAPEARAPGAVGATKPRSMFARGLEVFVEN
jgi:hypothetical protein